VTPAVVTLAVAVAGIGFVYALRDLLQQGQVRQKNWGQQKPEHSLTGRFR
jgi:hypothetical protein